MNLQDAMGIAKRYIIFGDPNGDLGSFDPIKGFYDDKNDIWEITCQFTKGNLIKKATVSIDNKNWNVREYRLLEE